MNRCAVKHRPGSKAGRECAECNPRAAAVVVPRPLPQGSPVEYGDVSGRLRLACDPATAADVLEALVGSTDDNVRHLVARNPSTPPRALEVLAGDDVEDVRRSVAQHRGTPPQTLEALVGDDVVGVRRSVAEHPNALPHALEALAGDDDWSVRRSVAQHRGTPPHALEMLASGNKPGDERWGVREAAQEEVRRRIRERLGPDARNVGAIKMLRSMPWWELTRDDPQVQLVLRLFPDEAH